jgi:hypothetical protein
MSNDLNHIERRIMTARTWAVRVERLLKKKKKSNPFYSEAEFCRAYGFDYGFFSRVKHVRVVPSQGTIDKIENALKCEGV